MKLVRSDRSDRSVGSTAAFRAVSLDVGGTLIEPWPSVGQVYASVAGEFGCPAVDPTVLTGAFGAAWQARRDFDYSRAEWRELVEATFAAVDTGAFRMSDECFGAVYDRFARAPAWRVFDDVRPVLGELRARGIPVVLVSNWDERLRPLLAELGLLDAVTDVVVSREVGQHKPAPGIFLEAAKRLGVAPGELLHVGDSEREDVEGARRAGLQACWLRRNGGERAGAGVVDGLWRILEFRVE